MKEKRILIVLVALALATSACTSAAPTPTPVEMPSTPAVEAASPTVASGNPSPVAATPANGIPLNSSGISMLIPQGLATGAQVEVVPASSGPDLPVWEVSPAYTRVQLQNYPLQGTLLEPQIFFYPASEFAGMSDGAAQAIAGLKSVLASPTAMPDHMPFLPNLNAAQVFYSNFQVIPFQIGTGIRYLTQFDQGPLPINNHELIYTFQGLTKDEKYYVAATLPINAAFLSADGSRNSPVPSDGVLFDWNNPNSMPVYLEAIKQRLSSTEPNAFTPALPVLDALIQSISVSLP